MTPSNSSSDTGRTKIPYGTPPIFWSNLQVGPSLSPSQTCILQSMVFNFILSRRITNCQGHGLENGDLLFCLFRGFSVAIVPSASLALYTCIMPNEAKFAKFFLLIYVLEQWVMFSWTENLPS